MKVHTQESEDLQKIADLVADIGVGMMTMQDNATGELHSRPMMPLEIDDELAVLFFTRESSLYGYALDRVNLAFADPDHASYVSIVGRSKDLIITGGYNVYPAEIEGYLNEMDGVAESAVIGVPHPDFGEGVVAVVVGKPGATPDAAALITALKGRIASGIQSLRRYARCTGSEQQIEISKHPRHQRLAFLLQGARRAIVRLAFRRAGIDHLGRRHQPALPRNRQRAHSGQRGGEFGSLPLDRCPGGACLQRPRRITADDGGVHIADQTMNDIQDILD